MAHTQPLQEITLEQMLDARENRARRQKELIAKYQKPLLCFTMNIAGPIKNSDLITQGFISGIEDFIYQMKCAKAAVLFQEIYCEPTGNEAFFVVDIDGFLLKQLTCEIEDKDELGRLFDMDVIIPPSKSSKYERKLDRQDFGLAERKCLICGKPAKECSSRRIHTVRQLQETTRHILNCSLNSRCASRIAEFAVRSLLYEVSVTPKPGLVDRFHNGSHKDMDFYTFLNSAAALWPYFYTCAHMGLEYRERTDFSELFSRLRPHGKTAENQMLRSTNGINTHKGAIFTMGVLCAAVGACQPADWKHPEKVFGVCADMTKNLSAHDFDGLTIETAKTVGQKLYLAYGIKGVRGQMEEGLPAVSMYGLPLLEKLLAEGKSADEAGAATLLSIMAHMTDTNLIARSDIAVQKKAAESAKRLLRETQCPPKETIEALDRQFVAKNLSPGGSADLLAVCWMMYFIKTSGFGLLS